MIVASESVACSTDHGDQGSLRFPVYVNSVLISEKNYPQLFKGITHKYISDLCLEEQVMQRLFSGQ